MFLPLSNSEGFWWQVYWPWVRILIVQSCSRKVTLGHDFDSVIYCGITHFQSSFSFLKVVPYGLSVLNIFVGKKPMSSFVQYIISFVLGFDRIDGIPSSTDSQYLFVEVQCFSS